MNNAPLVSILIPAYNHEKFVERAVRSAVAQTYPRVELLVLDDGSADNTLSVLYRLQQEITNRFTRFLVQTQPNAGTATTVNRLRLQAQGKYILFLASDDELLPNCLETQVAFLEEHPDYVINVGDNEFIDPNGNRLERDPQKNDFFPLHTSHNNAATFGTWLQQNRPDVNFTSDQFGTYASLIKGNYLPNGIMYRKEVLDKCEPLSTKTPLEDWFMNLQMAKQGKFHYTAEVLFRYRIHETNTIKNGEKMERMTNQTRFYDWYLSAMQDSNSRWKEIVNSYYLSFAIQKKIGGLGIYLIKRKNIFFSQRGIQVGRHLFIFRSRRLNDWPDWWPDKTYELNN